MSVGKRFDTSEPLTEHDVAARLNRAAERVLRIMWDTRQLGLAKQVRDSRYLVFDVLGELRAELDLWDVESRPLAAQLDPLTPDAQAVADAYARWLSSYKPTGAPMSEQSTEQNPAETVSTTVETENATVSVDDSTAAADAADDAEKTDDAETSGSGDASSDGSAEDGDRAE